MFGQQLAIQLKKGIEEILADDRLETAVLRASDEFRGSVQRLFKPNTRANYPNGRGPDIF